MLGLDDRGFQQGVAKIKRSLKVVKSEFAAASSKLGDFGKSTEGLKLKSQTLNKQIQLQKDKVPNTNKIIKRQFQKDKVPNTNKIIKRQRIEKRFRCKSY